MLNINNFISTHITHRPKSMFAADIATNATELSERIVGKSVLVIGGAGSIGSSYIKALLQFKPAKLVVVDTNENGLTELTRDLRSSPGTFIPADYKTYPMNFSDSVFEQMFRANNGFNIVANFAAHKHVRSEKDQYSISALLQNNVIKAEKLLQLLINYKPEHFFCVSTDKAANPVNIMGASKKIMEEVIMAYNNYYPITTARFANVAFSNGSLPDGFIYRLMKQQPFSAPSDVKRYFVSPEESGQICLLACILGEPGDIFFPKLNEGQMMSFSDIANKFLQSMGMQPQLCTSEDEAKQLALNWKPGDKTYPVYYFTSDTSGEKAYEEFFTETEITDLTSFKALGVIKNAPRKNIGEIQLIIQQLNDLLSRTDLDKDLIVQTLHKFLPNFGHIETGKNLDQKM